MANFTLQVETAASKAKANPPQKDPLFYILPPLIVAAVFAVVYGITPPKSAATPEKEPAAEAPAKESVAGEAESQAPESQETQGDTDDTQAAATE